MSLFDELKEWEIIERPQKLWSTNRIRKERAEENEKKKKEERKKLCEEMRAKLSPEEYKKWKRQLWYSENREKHIQKELDRQKRIKAEEDALMEEIYKDVYDELPEPIDYDAYYMEKFKSDDLVNWKYIFAWRKSKVLFMKRNRIPKYKKPFRICKRKALDKICENLSNVEIDAYEHLKPYEEEIDKCALILDKTQFPWKYIRRFSEWKLDDIIKNCGVASAHVWNVADWMKRGKYIIGQAYLWRNSFILGDVLVTQTGHLFRISLDNNLPWLTKDTVEEIHNLRMEWRKRKWKTPPPIYIVNDAYLIKVPINERENLYFISPT